MALRSIPWRRWFGGLQHRPRSTARPRPPGAARPSAGPG
jgi:hypothetical protein